MEENKVTEEQIEEIVSVVDEAIEEVEETESMEAIEEVAGEETEQEAPKKKFPWLWVCVAGIILVVMAITVWLTVLGSKVDYKDYVKLGQYTGLVVPVEEVTVTDEDVSKKIESILAEKITYEAVDRAAQMDDVVKIDYVGRYAADGSEFAGGSASGVELELGSGKLVKGFEEGLVGVSAGETIELPLTFPEDYKNTMMAGVDVIFTVTVHEVTEPVTPVLDETFVKANSDVETVDEYRQMIYEQLLAAKKAEAEAAREDKAWKQVVENTEILGYPESELAKQLENVRADLSAYYGMEYEELIKAYTSYAGITEEQFAGMVDQQAKYELEYKMITYVIAEKEGITWTQEEYDEQVNLILTNSGALSVESFETTYKVDFEDTYKNRIIDSILHSKVTGLIRAQSVT